MPESNSDSPPQPRRYTTSTPAAFRDENIAETARRLTRNPPPRLPPQWTFSQSPQLMPSRETAVPTSEPVGSTASPSAQYQDSISTATRKARSSRKSTQASDRARVSGRNINYEDMQRLAEAVKVLDNRDLLALHAANRNESSVQAKTHFTRLLHSTDSQPKDSNFFSVQNQERIQFPLVPGLTIGSPVAGMMFGPRVPPGQAVPVGTTSTAVGTAVAKEKKRSLPDEIPGASSAGIGKGKSPAGRKRESKGGRQRRSQSGLGDSP